MEQRVQDVRAHRHLDSLLSIILRLVKSCEAEGLVGVLEISERDRLLRIPCCKRWATEALPQNLIAQSEPLRVEVQGEDATLGLISRSVEIPFGSGGERRSKIPSPSRVFVIATWPRLGHVALLAGREKIRSCRLRKKRPNLRLCGQVTCLVFEGPAWFLPPLQPSRYALSRPRSFTA